MNSTYAQKSSTVQKVADSKAASVLDSSAQGESLQRKADMANNATQRAEAPRPNNTGMPDNLKAEIESLSGFSMDDVRVHYNSSKPATVQALAYTQGTDIHVAPGQEKCLPHEAWHVAQQMAGRVSPTTNINGMPVNDNAALEHEADVMGEKAVQCVGRKQTINSNITNKLVLQKKVPFKAGDPMGPYVFKDGNLSSKSEAGDDSASGSASSKKKATTPSQTQGGKKVGAPPLKKIKAPKESRIPAPVEESVGCVRDLEKSKVLPHIAFETMSNIADNRCMELTNLYNNEISKYDGRASVYMGVNACADKEKNLDGKVGEATRKCNELVSSIHGEKKDHEIWMIPFAYVKDPKTHLYDFPFYQGRSLLMKNAAKCGADFYRWVDSDVRDDMSIQNVNRCGFWSFLSLEEENLKKYFSHILKYLKDNGVDVDPLQTELDKLNFGDKNELYGFIYQIDQICIAENLGASGKKIFDSCGHFMVYSGFYEWFSPIVQNPPISKGNRPFERYSKIVELMNRYELDLRKKYIGKNFVVKERGKLGFYFPEPTLYMNKNAHDVACDLENVDYSGDQSRESEEVLKMLKQQEARGTSKLCLFMKEHFLVKKPLKKEFSTDIQRYSIHFENIACVMRTTNGEIKNRVGCEKPISEKSRFYNEIKNVRQTAFGDDWDLSKDDKEPLLERMHGEWCAFLWPQEK